jgi:hypothetical protein
MQARIGKQRLFDESILQIWLNAEQYHTDETNAHAWSEIERVLSSENTRALVITQINSKVRAINSLRQLVGLVIGRKV